MGYGGWKGSRKTSLVIPALARLYYLSEHWEGREKRVEIQGLNNM